jgi:hypothetical protein
MECSRDNLCLEVFAAGESREGYLTWKRKLLATRDFNEEGAVTFASMDNNPCINQGSVLSWLRRDYGVDLSPNGWLIDKIS